MSVDYDGSEFYTVESAREEAVICARELLANAIRSNMTPPTAVVVADDQDREVARTRLVELVPSFDP